MSPVLFNIFIQDIPKFERDPALQIFQFADDTAVVARGTSAEGCARKLEKGLNAVWEYSRRWNIQLNEKKTEVLWFGKKAPKDKVIRWGKNIQTEESSYILGNSN